MRLALLLRLAAATAVTLALPAAAQQGEAPAKRPEVAVKIGGLLQADGRLFVDDDAGALTDDLLVRRARVDLQAKLGRLSARIAPELGMGRAVIQDAYADASLPAGLRLRVGKFIPPIGLERLQTAAAYFFLETGLASNLAPTRDVGLQLGGDLGKVATFAVGLFAGAPDAGAVDGDSSDDKELAARVFVKPFAAAGPAPLAGLGLGVSGSYGATRGDPAKTTDLGGYKSDALQVIFDYRKAAAAPGPSNTAWSSGRRARVGLQGSWFWGPAGLFGELLMSQQRVLFGATPQIARLRNQGWQVAAIYDVTGEPASDGVIVPAAPLDGGGWGALQVAVRVAGLDVDDDAFPVFADPTRSVSRATSVGAGLSWWPIAGVRVMLDLVRTAFDGGAGTAPAVEDRPAEQALLARFQAQL